MVESEEVMESEEASDEAEDVIEILFEYEGSKRALAVTPSNLVHIIENELKDGFGIDNATVSCSRDKTSDFLIQKWCLKWNTFIDLANIGEIKDEDRITIINNPISSSKVNNILRSYSYSYS